jgi:ribosomal protein S12 methylthiotransferase accessory factor YcaO
MRKILEKLLEKGFKVAFSEEAGVPVICIHKNEELIYTCKLGIGRFKEDIEDTLNAALMELCK